MSIEEACKHLRDLVTANPKLKGIEVLDVTTPALMKRHAVRGGVCLVGSKTYKMTEEQVQSWRDSYRILDDYEFIGLDIEAGLNVDVVADLCAADFQHRHPELQSRFGLVVCGALLEHVTDPFTAARNVVSLLKPGGHLYYLGPWVWGFHAYPDDYWRFSISALRLLFSQLDWKEWWYSGTKKGVGLTITDVKQERAFFQVPMLEPQIQSGCAGLISDRMMPYINIGGIAQRLYYD